MRFRILGKNEQGDKAVFIYDNETSLFHREDVDLVQLQPKHYKSFPHFTSVDSPASKSSDVKILKISLGLSCNYECTYCSQRFVPHGDSTTQHDVDAFVKTLTENLTAAPKKIEFWGGEPFVYWKTLKPLAEKLRELYPNAGFLVITNGSLLDIEKNKWLDEMGFAVGVSHDGPGYHVRGLDPLDDPEKAAAIIDLAQRLGPQQRISFNAMIHKGNPSRAAIQEWLEARFGVGVTIGEGSFVDPYDEGGLQSMFSSQEEHINFRSAAYKEIRENKTWAFHITAKKVKEFVESVRDSRPASALGQKCGMDTSDTFAVDMKGNLLTCQNVSAAATAPNGKSHKIGHITDLANVKLNTSTHWSKRPECLKCPVLQLCKGACMFLEGNLWTSACDGAYSDNIPFLAAGVEALTGFMPYYIDGDFREDRKDIFGLVNGVPKSQVKKPFPIPVVTI
jgi:uncharacterized protein